MRNNKYIVFVNNKIKTIIVGTLKKDTHYVRTVIK